MLTTHCALFALLAVGVAATQAQSTETSLSEREIYANGLGRYYGEGKTAIELRAAYPDAEILIEPIPGQSKDAYPLIGRYVVQIKGERLFVAACGCHLSRDEWVVTQHKRYNSLGDVPLRPSTRNPSFKTFNGIGVGISIEKLLAIYTRSEYDLYAADVPPEASPIVCLMRRAKVPKSAASAIIESLAFEIAVPLGANRAKFIRSGKIGVDAIASQLSITEVFTSSDCRTLARLGAP